MEAGEIATEATEPAAEAQPAAVEAETTPEPQAQETQPEDDEVKRDKRGRFMPLDEHKAVLERERTKREAVERELEEARNKLTPSDDDAAFEAGLENVPDALATVLRAERAARKAAEAGIQALKAEREEAVKAAERATVLAEHQLALKTVPTLEAAYADPIKKVAIDAISNALLKREGYEFATRPIETRADREAHYKAVQDEYLRAFPAVTTKPTLPPAPKPAAPQSLSQIPRGAPPAGTEAEALEAAAPIAGVAAFAQMTEAQLSAHLLRNYGGG